jgi:rRNA processing protein Gar1
MKVLGPIEEITYDGNLIVTGTFAPRPGSVVLDNRKKTLGKVRRIFGPVSSPYVSVEPTGDSGLLRMIGKQVYIEGVDDDGKGKRRHRGN